MHGGVPDPWAHLGRAMPDVLLMRERIAEPGRYYDEQRVIVLRKGMRLEDERRYLWHEIVHARRRDQACQGWLREHMEQSVEREAARLAMPIEAMQSAMARSAHWADFLWHMKVPEEWVRYRLQTAHPSEQGLIERECRWTEIA